MSSYTNGQLCAFIRHLIGMPYWYATCLYPCTQSLLNGKAQQYPDWYTAERIAGSADDITEHKVCGDCVGMIKGFMWTNGGVGVLESIGTGTAITSHYATNGCPDQSADGMYTYCVNKGSPHGSISTIPEIPGVAVRKEGHVGVYVGHGSVIEFRGFDYGCVETDLDKRDFTEWYQMPFLTYTGLTKIFPIGGMKRGRVRVLV